MFNLSKKARMAPSPPAITAGSSIFFVSGILQAPDLMCMSLKTYAHLSIEELKLAASFSKLSIIRRIIWLGMSPKWRSSF